MADFLLNFFILFFIFYFFECWNDEREAHASWSQSHPGIKLHSIYLLAGLALGPLIYIGPEVV